MRFTKAALAVALIGFLTFGFMPGQIKSDCAPALVAAVQRRQVPVMTDGSEVMKPPPRVTTGTDGLVRRLPLPPGYEMEGRPHRCNSPARSALIKVALIGTGFVAAVAAAEYVLKTGKETQ